ncbi:MAG TPA: PAS domain S-box protein, partial [Anaerolineales bacterium]|nr:PAS domain S-box protein [Anaerolineales bacterium]
MKMATRILIVEDMAADADLAIHTVRKVLKDCEFKIVETRQDFLKALEVFQPDMILSDYSLPHFDGRQALQLALQHAPLTPLIIWTGSISEDVAVDCMKAGANNYVIKENLKRLGPAVIHALEEKESLMARRQTEEALQNSEKRFRALIENGLDNISLLKADGTLIWESPATIRMLDYAPDQFTGHNIFELMHPDDLQWTRSVYTKLVQEPGGRQSGVFRLRHSDGTWRWAEAIATNMLDEPSVNAIVINYRDITERKQAEIKLQQRNDDLALINALNEVINRGEGVDAVVNLMAKELKRIFSGEGTTIYLLDPDGQSLKMQQYFLSPEILTKIEKVIGRAIPSIEIPIREGGYFQRVLRSGHGAITSDPQAIQKWMEEFVETVFLPRAARGTIRKLIPQIYKFLNIRSTILIPLISDGKAIGLLDVSSPNLFTVEDLKRIENIGGQLTTAIQRKQAEQVLHHSLEQTKRGQHLLLRLSEVGRVIQRAHSAEEVYRAICKGLDSLGYRVAILSLTEDKRHLTLAHSTLPLKMISAIEKVLRSSISNYRFPLTDESLLKNALNKSEATLTLLNEEEVARVLPRRIRPFAGNLLPLFDTRYIIAAPITAGDESHSLLVVGSPELSESDVLPIATFAAQASIALENAQLYESVQQELYERKQAQARLNDLLAFNEKILNHSLVGILTYKLTGECIYANENAAAIVGTRVEKLLTQNFHTIAAWKNSGLYNLVQRAITTQAPVTADIHHVSTFGRDTWLTVHCVTFKSKDEDQVLLSVSDITERKQAEEALRESKNRLILALFGAQMSVWEWDLQTDRILWSPEFFEITGVREDEFGGTFEAFTHLIHSHDVERVIASARKTMNERTLFAEEFRITRPDGEIRWLSNLGQAEYDATGDHLRLIGTVQDITRRKQAETMLQESEERLSSAFEYASIGMALVTPTGQWFRVNRALCD